MKAPIEWRGGIKFSDDETSAMLSMRSDKVRYSEIADRLNETFHNGGDIRTVSSVSSKIFRLCDHSLQVPWEIYGYFLCGMNTYEIAQMMEAPESAVYNALAQRGQYVS